MARNVHQVLGADLKTPVKMIICWTPDGSLDGKGTTEQRRHGDGAEDRV